MQRCSNYTGDCRLITCLFLLIFSVSCVFASPSKVESKTAASKAPPVGAVGAPAKKATVVKKIATNKVSQKTPTKAVVDKAKQTQSVKGVATNILQKDSKKEIKKESVVDKFAPQLRHIEKKTQPKKKKIKLRNQVIDGKVCMWGRDPQNAEQNASDAIRKFVSGKNEFQFKDAVIAEDGGKYYCILRFNFTDKIPENWYLESEMVTGFGKNKLRAFDDAVSRARSRVKSLRVSKEWQDNDSVMKNTGETGFIPYDFVFATAGKTVYCKVFFRYLKLRK